MTLSELREVVETVTVRRQRGRLRLASGMDGGVDRSLLAAERDAISWDAVGLVRELHGQADGRRAQRLKTLEHHLVALIAETAAEEPLMAIDRDRVALVAGVEAAEPIPLQLALARGSRELDREKRARLESRALACAEQLRGPVTRAWDIHQRVSQKVGFRSWCSSRASAAELDLKALALDAEGFLAATDAMYWDVMTWWLRCTTGLQPRNADRHDLLHGLSLIGFDGLFPRTDAELRTWLASFRTSGLLDGAEALRFDGEPRDRKVPEGLGVAIDAPDEVWAVYRADGGVDSAIELLRAWGEAIHGAHIDAGRPFEDRALGDRTIAVGVGTLFADVVLERAWLKRRLDQIPPDLPRLLALRALFRLRHAAAVLLHVLQVDSDGFGAAGTDGYSERLTGVLGVRWPGALESFDCVPSADILVTMTAPAFGAVLSTRLREQFDEDWWANPRAGAFLKKLFEFGRFESATAAARRLELAAPRLLAAVDRFQRILDA